jgi:RNA polymerase sigma-70 factor (ECF subfamily)
VELRELVRTALATLGRRQREALELQQFQDQSYAEVGDRLALTPQAAKSLLYRARNQLREVLAPYVLTD